MCAVEKANFNVHFSVHSDISVAQTLENSTFFVAVSAAQSQKHSVRFGLYGVE